MIIGVTYGLHTDTYDRFCLILIQTQWHSVTVIRIISMYVLVRIPLYKLLQSDEGGGLGFPLSVTCTYSKVTDSYHSTCLTLLYYYGGPDTQPSNTGSQHVPTYIHFIIGAGPAWPSLHLGDETSL